jgi:type I restriction enzyme S subunit
MRVDSFSAKTTVDSVRLEMISEMIIPIPPIIEQEKIVEILSKADKKIEKEEAYKEKLGKIKK